MKLDYLQKNSKMIAAIVGILLVFACSLYFLAIPKIINIDKYRRLIVTQTAKNLQLPIAIGKSKATMTWNWGIVVHSENINIKHSDNTKYISTGPVDVEISIPFILRHQIRIRNINIKNPEIIMSRLTDGSFDVEELISEKSKKFIKYKTIFKDANINLENYRIYFTDKFVSPNTKYLVFGHNLKISDFEPKKYISVDANGRIFSQSRPSTSFDIKYSGQLPLDTKDLLKNDIFLIGEVKDFYPDMFANYFKPIPNYSMFSGIMDSEFKINLHKIESDIDEISITNTINEYSKQKTTNIDKMISPSSFDKNTKISITAQIKGQDFIIKDASIKNKDLDVNVQGNVNKKLAQNSDLDLNLSVNNSKLESIYSLFPKDFKVPFNLINKFKKYKVKGILSANMDIKGTKKTPDIFGALEFKKISLTRNSTTIKNTQGKLIFDGKKYNINAHALLDKNTYIQTSGYIAPQLKKINIDIKSNNISITPTQQLCLIISDLANLKLGDIRGTCIKGRGNVNLNISGDIKSPYLNGYLNFLDTQILYAGLSEPIKNLSGQVRFANKKTYIANLKAKIAQSSININGCLQKNKSDITLTSKRLDLAAFRNLLLSSNDLRTTRNVISELGSFSGFANTFLKFQSNEKNKLCFNKLNLKIIESKTNYKDIPVNLSGGNIIVKPEGTDFKTLSGRIGNSPITIDGEFKNNSGKMKLLIKSKVDSSDIYYYVNPRLVTPLEAKGTFPVIAVIVGTTDDWILSAQASLNKGDYIYLRQNPSFPFEKSRTVNIKVYGRSGIMAVDEIQIAIRENSISILPNFVIKPDN